MEGIYITVGLLLIIIIVSICKLLQILGYFGPFTYIVWEKNKVETWYKSNVINEEWFEEDSSRVYINLLLLRLKVEAKGKAEKFDKRRKIK